MIWAWVVCVVALLDAHFRGGWSWPMAAAIAVAAAIVGHALGESAWSGTFSARTASAFGASVILVGLCRGHAGLQAGVLSAFLLCGGASWSGIRLVTTPSIAPGLYRSWPVSEHRVERGKYACLPVQGDDSPKMLQAMALNPATAGRWLGVTFLKKVVAVPGDSVDRTETGELTVNGVPVPHSRLARKKLGAAALRPPALPRTLSTQEVWLGSDHDSGVDSRYFGAVSRKALSCVARPLWTW